MAKRLLQIVSSAYRGTLEEQDDTVVWLTHAMRGAGAELTVLLRGSAVNYLVRGQDACGLRFGDKSQTQPPRIDEDVAKLAGKGVRVLFVEEDADERGIAREDVIDAAEGIPRSELPRVFSEHDLVCAW